MKADNVKNAIVGFTSSGLAYMAYLDGMYFFTFLFLGLSYWTSYLIIKSEKKS